VRRRRKEVKITARTEKDNRGNADTNGEVAPGNYHQREINASARRLLYMPSVYKRESFLVTVMFIESHCDSISLYGDEAS